MVFMLVLSASTYSGLMFDLVDGRDHLEQRATGFGVSPYQQHRSMVRAAAGEVPPGYRVDKRPT